MSPNSEIELPQKNTKSPKRRAEDCSNFAFSVLLPRPLLPPSGALMMMSPSAVSSICKFAIELTKLEKLLLIHVNDRPCVNNQWLLFNHR